MFKAYCHLFIGDLVKAVEASLLALKLFNQAADAHLQSRTLSLLSLIKGRQGHPFEALSLSYSAYAITLESGNLYAQARALMRQCECLTNIGRDFRKACSTIEEALLLVDALGFDSGSGLRQVMLHHKGAVLSQKTEYNNARAVHQETVGDYNLKAAAVLLSSSAYNLPIDAHNPIQALFDIAFIDVAAGDWDAARCGYDMEDRVDTLHYVVKHYSSFLPSYCDIIRGQIYLCREQYDLAQRMFQQVLTSGTQTMGIHLTQLSREGLVKTALAKADDNEASLRHTIVYLLGERRVHTWPAIHRALRCLGDVLLIDGDRTTAEVLFDIALEGFTFSDIHKGKSLTPTQVYLLAVTIQGI